ncbi:Na(+)/H(+) antiporter NhaA [Microbacterium sorbitolivorans]|uniref:Na(+)/H(+) antiporter NhaA n=1 Tax=Microbacterium sorbitolivorans TaxID=1867410 RepID=A0A367Y881_9MICO|nr:Na+/H+ antiporter NhaA [Microbacterium sorbitolivorans]RCK62017.1 Na+/H+ antiporter NhaA [Microbacterium sorbitolivorans]GGF43826.1 Na(+)/H(+) antiporter NhaA [Microbacterium sorbitolivorans]
MKLLRSERFPAFLLLGAAALGLILANLPFGESVIHWSHTEIGVPGLELSLSHWVADFLLAIFFFGVAVELQFEMTRGQLNSLSKAVRPAIAAAGGVIVPIIVFLLIAGRGDTASGWPIPTATDIAFALGVLAMFGKGLPKGVRVFLLALAIIDDIVGIVFIAVLFATDLDFGMMLAGLACVVAFAILSRFRARANTALVVSLMIVAALAAWVFIFQSGIHATIAGVMLGLVIRQDEGMRARHALEPWINGLILPIFAFFSALVVIPQVALDEISPALWGILVALPAGKLIGISLFGWLAQFVGKGDRLPFADIIPAAALGGIGFTVSLLLSRLAYADHVVADEAVLGVLLGSLVSLILSAILVPLRARHHRRLAA